MNISVQSISMRICLSLMLLIAVIGCNKKVQSVVTPPPPVEKVVKVLSNPQISTDSIFFIKESTVSLYHEVDSAIIRYSIDGKEVNENSPIYNGPLKLDVNTDIKCQAFHPDYKSSEIERLSIRKCSNFPQLNLKDSSTKPKEPYDQLGLHAVSDLKKGTVSNDNNSNWIGYQEEEIVFEYNLNKPIYCTSISISTLCDPLKGVLNPKRFEIDIDDELVGFLQVKTLPRKTPAEIKIWDFSIRDQINKSIKIKVVNSEKLPSWHEDQMEKPWILIDEVVIN